MKLYNTPNGSRIRLVDETVTPPAAPAVNPDDILMYQYIDGAYGKCINSNGEQVYIHANSDVEVI